MSAIEVLKEVSLELKNGTLGKDLELGYIEQLLEIGIYKLQKKGYFKNKKAIVALEKLDRLEKWLNKKYTENWFVLTNNKDLEEARIIRNFIKEVRGVLENDC